MEYYERIYDKYSTVKYCIRHIFVLPEDEGILIKEIVHTYKYT